MRAPRDAVGGRVPARQADKARTQAQALLSQGGSVIECVQARTPLPRGAHHVAGRADVWCALSGADAARSRNAGLYQRLVKLGEELEAKGEGYSAQIVLDMPRTYPENRQFQPEGCERQQQLHRILVAYSVFRPEAGYCQGMNFVAGMLLLVVGGDEERAFWLFDGAAKLMPPELYGADMQGAHIECATLVALLREAQPAACEELRRLGALDALPIIVTKWLIGGMFTTLPVETALRVWDAVFSEGWKVLYRVGFALVVRAHTSGELSTHNSGGGPPAAPPPPPAHRAPRRRPRVCGQHRVVGL